MIEKIRALYRSFLFCILLAGACLTMVLVCINAIINSDYAYGELRSISRNIDAQKVLLRKIIIGYPKEKAVDIIKKGVLKSETPQLEIVVTEDSLVFGRFKIKFKDSLVVDVE